MWSYQLSVKNAAGRLLDIQFTLNRSESTHTELCLPRWRPGRYEMGNFAKNLLHFQATDENGVLLPFHKKDAHTWLIENKQAERLHIKYQYYAAQADAGACWVDEKLIYVNPVHCFMYCPGMLHTPCQLTLDIPSEWQIACSMEKEGERTLLARDFHELVDAPFFASPNLQHESYSLHDIRFHIWFEGDCQPDWKKIIPDFSAFTEVQLRMMDSFPVKDYHFLILVLPYRFYHGVEHVGSTVLALGPGYKLMSKDLYSDLMGVASHELFHVWNVKTLRPADFNEYDYSRENYSRLGWIYEGFTTYYGDLFLARSGFFSVADYLSEINQRLQKHMDNAGRFNLSVAESSFETWLDGYVPGTPNRKTSIYDEGSLIALMLDLQIRQHSGGAQSLDDLFRTLYHDFSVAQGHGYKEADVRMLAKALGGDGALSIIDQYADKATSYEQHLQQLLPSVGCYLSKSASKEAQEHLFGFRTSQEGAFTKIASVWPGSLAAAAGLAKDDEIITCNAWKVEANLNDLIRAAAGQEVKLGVISQRRWKEVTLKGEGIYFQTWRVVPMPDADESQRAAFKEWCGRNFPD